VEVGARPLSIRVVTDGRAGIENQALGLAEAVARLTPASIEVRRVRWLSAFDWLPADLKTTVMLDPAGDPPFPEGGEPWPDLWIAAGRASLPLSLTAKRRSDGRAFVVQIQDPRLDPARFDLVVAPAHDGLAGPNVVSITGSPHRVTADTLAQAAPDFAERLEPLPRPRVAVLIGGRSKAFDLTPDHATVLGNRIAAAVQAEGGSLMLTYSRRTPDAAKAAMTEPLSALPGLIWDGAGPNPLFAMLDAADHILVTEDSANMAAEAASTGKPVHILPMVALKPPGKFARLHADLREKGAARLFDGRLETWHYQPLAETERAARVILMRLGQR
jgi:mitochondrial fission protein ELM1